MRLYTVGKRLVSRSGTLMMLLMVMIVIVGILGARIAPEYQTQNQRRNEKFLRGELGGLRASIDLERALANAVPSVSPCAAEYEALASAPADRDLLEAYLKKLDSSSLLPNYKVRDSVVPNYQWGSAPGYIYWDIRQNLLQPVKGYVGMTSFEGGWVYDTDVGTFSAPGWKNGLDPGKAVATLSNETPSTETNMYDDYYGQNKMGRMHEGLGYSLKIQKVN